MSSIVITGSNRGIGLALASLYARRGDTVFACCRVPSEAGELQALAKTHQLAVLPLDVRDDASVASMARALGDTPVDVLINNAGVSGGPLEQQTAARMDFAAWALSLDLALAYGYSASKAALNKFMRLAAPELARDGIAVGVVHPGWVKTDMGGPGAHITPADSAAGIATVIDQLSLDNTGGFWKWNGSRHDW